MHVCAERAQMLAARVEKLALLRRTERAAAQGRDRALQFSAERRQYRHRGFLSVFESLAPNRSAR